ncbi:MAG: DUF1992 domain-containing protein [Anaerolineae bacterium]|jgi:DnaJ family protein C protein 28|nr:DUF1992 domain-containing protein [Anaerolineae bacterium]
MDDREIGIEQMLKKAQESWQNLPGAGKPLNLDQNPHAPAEMQMANKLLKENDLAPAWITEGKELDATRDKLLRQIARAAESGEVKSTLRDSVTAFNKRILTYNLKLPAGVAHKFMIDLARELRR